MTKLAAKLQTLRSDKGATAVEYGLLVALIAAVIVVVVGILGGQIHTAFQTIVDANLLRDDSFGRGRERSAPGRSNSSFQRSTWGNL